MNPIKKYLNRRLTLYNYIGYITGTAIGIYIVVNIGCT